MNKQILEWYAIRSEKDGETIMKEFQNINEGKDWIVNHLDLSKNWYIELTDSDLSFSRNKMKAQSTTAQVAGLIRKELKEKYPETKFRVTSQQYAGGDSVSIHWTDGASRDEVDSLVDKYQGGDFDGMEDIYNYRKNAPELTVKYVQCQREISYEEAQRLAQVIKDRYAITLTIEPFIWKGVVDGYKVIEGNQWDDDLRCWKSDLIYRASVGSI